MEHLRSVYGAGLPEDLWSVQELVGDGREELRLNPDLPTEIWITLYGNSETGEFGIVVSFAVSLVLRPEHNELEIHLPVIRIRTDLGSPEQVTGFKYRVMLAFYATVAELSQRGRPARSTL